jgi:hypothetical protein
MPWVAVSDDASDNAHVVRAGPLAELLWRRSLEYCNRNLTDGFLPRAKLGAISPDWHRVFEEIPDGRLVSTPEPVDLAVLVDRLLREGLWARTENGYEVRDVRGQDLVPYLDHQPSAREVKRERRRAREQRSVAGRASAQKRQREGQRDVNGSANGKGNGTSTGVPTGSQREV